MDSSSRLKDAFTVTFSVALFSSLFLIGGSDIRGLTSSYGALLQYTDNNNSSMVAATQVISQNTSDGPIMLKEQNLTKTSLPVTLPLTPGYANGHEVFYISTEASDRDLASLMTNWTGARVA
ncbi:MAG: hypothetical protein M3261_08105, partial [Thermoproteota archaeon]|nr:hypothetical protein [Thermoproteota archaeon]